MSISKETKKLVKAGFSDKGSLIQQGALAEFEKRLKQFAQPQDAKGYTIPPLDTIGQNFYGKFSSQIKTS